MEPHFSVFNTVLGTFDLRPQIILMLIR